MQKHNSLAELGCNIQFVRNRKLNNVKQIKKCTSILKFNVNIPCHVHYLE